MEMRTGYTLYACAMLLEHKRPMTVKHRTVDLCGSFAM